MLDVERIRKDFPILDSEVNGQKLIYLDNAATTQLPECVLKRLDQHYRQDNANVHRGIHLLSERSTAAFEDARETVKEFLNAKSIKEIIFTQGTTDSINTVAQGLRMQIQPGDHIVSTQLEHHSDFLPWQRLCKERNAVFHPIPCPDGNLDMDAFKEALSKRPKVVAVTHVSNLTGTVMPIRQLAAMAHEAGALFLVDGAQGIRHDVVDVQELDCDFYCFSGHKILAPTGIGVLYGKEACLELLEPARVGGGMVDVVGLEISTYGPLPTRLEAGTPNYAGAIGLAEALKYLTHIGRNEIAVYEQELTEDAVRSLSALEGVHILGTPAHRSGVVSFTLTDVHPYDAASVLDKLGVALRSGNHCAQTALAMFREEVALRLSVAFYNTHEEIAACCQAIQRTMEMFAKWKKH